MADPEKKYKKCRACGKDILADATDCEHCGWDEEKAKAEVKKKRLLRDIEKEMDDAENKNKPAVKKNIWGF